MGLFRWPGSKEEQVEGIARSVALDYQEHVDEKGRSVVDAVLNFRIVCTDKAGNVINVIRVEMRGGAIEGGIAEGNVVRAKGQIVDGVMRPNEVANISVGSKVFSKELKLGRGEVVVMGVARTVQVSQQSYVHPVFGRTQVGNSVLNLKIERSDKEGNITSVMPIEMRGANIIGYIADGDRVMTKGKVEHGLLSTIEIVNITTNSVVRAK